VPSYGYTLWSELHDPRSLVMQAQRAEDHAFDFVVVSDHFHPWLSSHGHSPFAWSVLGAVADRTNSIGIATMVTCPFVRYHPAIVAQAAATVAVMSNGRFTLGLGAGENLNEHVVGQEWPGVEERHEMLREAVEVIRELWSGRTVDYEGEHVQVRDARVYDLPLHEPDIYMAVSGEESLDTAVNLGLGICTTTPEEVLTGRYRDAIGETDRIWGQLAVSWDNDEEKAAQLAWERFRFNALGWEANTELQNVQDFEDATRDVTVEQVTEVVPCGPDPEKVVSAIRQYTDAGYEHVALLSLGDNPDDFLHAWQDEIRPML
jgi:G6PDH family F420-dependent oxidoreductase